MVDVYDWYELGGGTPLEIVAHFPQLTVAGVHAAMAYFWNHEAEIRQQMREVNERVARMRAEAGPSKLDPYRRMKRDVASMMTR